jgi:IS5 family transposase
MPRAIGKRKRTRKEIFEELQSVKAGFLIAEKPPRLRTIKNKRERHYAKRWEQHKASIRAKVEHPFRVVKCQFRYVKVRYRGLARNTSQMLTLFALSSLWMDGAPTFDAGGRIVAPETRGNPRE